MKTASNLNIENLDRLIKDLSEEEELGFYMGSYITISPPPFIPLPKNYCGTACCIAGFIAIKYLGRSPIEPEYGEYLTSVSEDAAKWLGLSDYDAMELFYASNTKMELSCIDRSEAVRTLVKLKETGKVMWSDSL